MRKSFLSFLILSAISLAGCGGGSSSTPPGTSPPPPAGSAAATVDFGTVHQLIRGFGGATAWMPVMPASEVQALFGTGPGQIGLSILRVRIDPSSVTGGSNWDTEVANAKEAQGENAEVSVMATPWTPPAAMKTNNSVVMGSLLTTSYADYANYLEAFVNYMAAKGVNLYGISMQNEPDANVTYESCVWTPQQMDTWVADDASALSTRLMMPESEGFNTAYSDPTLNDPNAVGKIGIIAGHIYGTSPTFYTLAVNSGKDVWQTEHYLNPAGSQPAIGDALLMAKEIHDSMAVAQYNAYLWWWVADWNPGGGMTNTGLVDSTNAPTYFGWAMAQFARFIRPGYARVDATAIPAAGVYVSAYTGGGHSVIVAVNMNAETENVAFTVKFQTLTALVPYQTTAQAGVVQQSSVSVANNQFSYSLPAQSITTFVQ